MTIHDLSFEVLPAEFGLRQRWRRRLLARRAARVANRVITDTGFIRSQVAGCYGVVDERMAVVPLGVDGDRFSADGDGEDIKILNGLGVCSPYVLVPGTVLERRMPRDVLEAFAIARGDSPELELVFAGANRMRQTKDIERWIREFGLVGAVRQLGWVEETALVPLYRGAELGVYVSTYEGYGLPPLECLACGTPVVVSPGLGLDDVWPDYPYRAAEVDATSLSGLMREILGDPDRTGEAMEQAGPVLKDLSWERSSRLLVAELERALPS